MAKKRAKADLPDLVSRYQRAREAGKRGYERADRLIREIAEAVKPGEEIALNESGRKVVLHDKFEEQKEKGVIWTPTAARRYELEIIEV